MDFYRSKVILKKITALHDSAGAFEGTMSQMERDLLLHYLRELYEIISNPETLSDAAPVKTASFSAPSALEGRPHHPHTHEKPPSHVGPPVSESIPQAVKEQTNVEHFRKEESHPPLESIPVQSQDDKMTGSPTGNIISDETAPAKSMKSTDLGELFELSGQDNMSSRFSKLPIADIAKSMGINDRILTINELFDGDQMAFNDCIGQLNAFKTFDEARQYLTQGPAGKHQWASGGKRKKAETFLRLIRRRYL